MTLSSQVVNVNYENIVICGNGSCFPNSYLTVRLGQGSETAILTEKRFVPHTNHHFVTGLEAFAYLATGVDNCMRRMVDFAPIKSIIGFL
ncbi:MAG: hypothetical protein R3F51_26215 [Cyanobacteriota/Melainabacteria group bacterium]